MKPLKATLGLLFLLSILLYACAQSAAAPVQSFTWQIQVAQAEVKTNLKTIEVVTLYNQKKDEVSHENTPAAGNQYLLLKIKVNKTGEAPISFDWKDVSVQDAAGKSYSRHANDSFIEQHNYSPRLTGLTIRFGENEGWTCFEIPDSATTGKLFLVHTTNEGQQKIEIIH